MRVDQHKVYVDTVVLERICQFRDQEFVGTCSTTISRVKASEFPKLDFVDEQEQSWSSWQLDAVDGSQTERSVSSSCRVLGDYRA